MAIGNLDARAHSRTAGHSVAGALAYRLGADLVDTRTGTHHNYARRGAAGDVAAVGFCHGATSPGWGPGAQAWADTLESAERRCNSVVVRDVTVALPAELSVEQIIDAARELAQTLCDDYNTVAAWAVHPPDLAGDQRNWHAHILLATRALDPETGLPGAKLRQFHVRSHPRARHRDSAREQARTDSGGRDELRRIRARWEQIGNAHLAAAGRTERIALGRANDNRDRAPVLTRGEVTAERALWQYRHPDDRHRAQSVAALAIRNDRDGGCQTRRGRLLVEHLLARRREGRQHAGYHFVAMPELEPAEIEAAIAETLTETKAIQPLPPTRTRARRRRRARTAPSPAPTPSPDGPHDAPIEPAPALVPAPPPAAVRSPVQPIRAPHRPRPTALERPSPELVPSASPSTLSTAAAPTAAPTATARTRGARAPAPTLTLEPTRARPIAPAPWTRIRRTLRRVARQLLALPGQLAARLPPHTPAEIAAPAPIARAPIRRTARPVGHTHVARIVSLFLSADTARDPHRESWPPEPISADAISADTFESIEATITDELGLMRAQQASLARQRAARARALGLPDPAADPPRPTPPGHGRGWW